MADIFISYSKADRDLTVKLAAFLEAEGFTVWWDKSLKPADTFRDEIMKELANARAVVTIWTENSIKSDWVRAEAGRAKADGKLIPLKASGLSYDDIPLPFGEMHTENMSATELIRAAIVAQLAKPAVAPSALRTLLKIVRYQAFTWVGIVGGTLTLFTNLSSVLRLADWARWLVTHWHDWMHAVWAWVFSWIDLEIARDAAPLLSLLAFFLMLLIGIRLRTHTIDYANSYRHHIFRPFMKLMVGIGIYFGMTIISVLTAFGLQQLDYYYRVGIEKIELFVAGGAYLVPFISFVVYLSIISNQRLKTVGSCLFISVFIIVIAVVPLNQIFEKLIESGGPVESDGTRIIPGFVDTFVEQYLAEMQARGISTENMTFNTRGIWYLFYAVIFYVLSIPAMAVVIFTPIGPLTKRLGAIAIGLIIVTLLNEIAKLDLHSWLQAPK